MRERKILYRGVRYKFSESEKIQDNAFCERKLSCIYALDENVWFGSVTKYNFRETTNTEEKAILCIALSIPFCRFTGVYWTLIFNNFHSLALLLRKGKMQQQKTFWGCSGCEIFLSCEKKILILQLKMGEEEE